MGAVPQPDKPNHLPSDEYVFVEASIFERHLSSVVAEERAAGRITDNDRHTSRISQLLKKMVSWVLKD